MGLLQYLEWENIFLGAHCNTGVQAVALAAQMLCRLGYADNKFIRSVVERHQQMSVYLGRGLAVAHALEEGRQFVEKKGMVLLQFPEGAAFPEGMGYIVIGIAAQNEMHMELLSAIGQAFSFDHSLSYQLARAKSKQEMIGILKKGEE